MLPIDLRSDTMTRPTPGMRRAMAEAEVGDDLWGEDPTVTRLQQRVATLLGFEAALYVASGTMGNEIAIRLLARPGQVLAADERAHVIEYEIAGMAALSGVLARPLRTDGGRVTPDLIHDAARPPGINRRAARTHGVDAQPKPAIGHRPLEAALRERDYPFPLPVGRYVVDHVDRSLASYERPGRSGQSMALAHETALRLDPEQITRVRLRAVPVACAAERLAHPQQAAVQEVQLGCLDQPLAEVAVVRRQQGHQMAGLKHGQPLARGGLADAAVAGQAVEVQQLAAARRAQGRETLKDLQVADVEHLSKGRWYQLAADQGNANAMRNLGELYEKGLGVAADPVMVMKLERKAKEQEEKDRQTFGKAPWL